MPQQNESTISDAAVQWFGELDYAVRHVPELATGEPATGWDSFGEVVLVGRLRKTIQLLNSAIPEEASACAIHADRPATIRPNRIVRFERRPNP